MGSAIPGNKVPALTGSRILFRDGVPVACLVAGEVTFFEAMQPAAEWAAKNFLLRGHGSPTTSVILDRIYETPANRQP